MHTAEGIVQELVESAQLWERVPGLVGMRGDLLRLFDEIDARVAALGAGAAVDDWHVPPALSFETLHRARYFESFPHWLTALCHLPDSPTALAEIADDPDPPRTATRHLEHAPAALTPAVCYHVYEQLADGVIEAPQMVAVRGSCWRHEKGRVRCLERGWSFTMREIVCIGTAADVSSFLDSANRWGARLTASLSLDAVVAPATDPFFAAGGRGRQLIQRMKKLKHELLLPIGPDRRIAAASFNDHETFFGDAFGIRLPDGGPAHTACAAFGLERWVLAFLCAHGTDPEGWPEIQAATHMHVGGER